MYKIQMVLLIVVLFIGVVVQSCRKLENEGSEGCGAKNISAPGKTESHNMGQDCMNCHQPGAEGKGCFYVAGTVYDTTKTSISANAVITLYDRPRGGGNLIATIDGDGHGNFYTTNLVDFTKGLYPVVKSASGNTYYMPTSITTGACNSCHGVANDKIWVY